MADIIANLRSRMSDILMSPACQRIDFWWGPYHIDGSGYTAVGLSLIGKRHSLHLAVGGLQPNQGASYTAETNTLRVPDAHFCEATSGGSLSNLGWQRMSVVHECTHAITDQVRRHSTILARSDEVMAYVAGALYNRYDGGSFLTPADGIYAAADQVAAYLENRPGAIIGTADAVKALEDAITQSSTYDFIRRNAGTKYHNSGLPF